MPRPRSGGARGGLEARRRRARRRRAAGDAGQVRDRAGQRRAQRADPAHHASERRRAHAAGVDAQGAVARSRSRSCGSGSRMARSTGRTGRSSRRERPAVPERHALAERARTRSIASCWRGSSAKDSRRRAAADKETLISRVHADADRPAADARGGRRVRQRHERPMRTSGSSTGCSRRPPTASTWRAVARPRALGRNRRLPRRPSRPAAVAVARLGDRGVRAQHAVRRVRARGSSRAICCRTRRRSRSSRRRSCASASARPRTARSTRSTKPSTWSSAPTTRSAPRSWA